MAQIREIKASGGYLSFEAPVAYFGLNNIPLIDSIEVRWSDGNSDTYTGPFESNYHYRISRHSK